MSYPERFTLTLQEGVATVHLAEAICALNDGILEPDSAELDTWKTESAWTWYGAEDELRVLSTKFPEVTLCLFRDPREDEGTSSYTYFRDGFVQRCPAQITYEAFDPAKVRPAAGKYAEAPVKTAPAWNGRVSRGHTHAFTLVLDAPPEVIVGPFADALFEAGCDDASLGAADGQVRLDFDREAPTLIEAVCSAIEEVASVGGRVLRVVLAGGRVLRAEEVPRG